MPGEPPRRVSFLLTLLKRGAPAMATATDALSDEIADPTPVRALRRISRIAGPTDTAHRDGLLLRAARYVAFVPLIYRLLAVPGSFVFYLTLHGGRGALPVAAVTLVSVALNVFGIRWMLRSPFHSGNAAKLIGIDIAFTMVSQLVIALSVPPGLFEDAMLVPGKQLFGAVALLTLVLGVPAGLGLAIGSFPVRLLANGLSGRGFSIGAAVSTYPAMLGVLFTAAGGLVLIGLGSRLALAYGIRNGRLAERARLNRMLHDTVLQALESIVLSGDIEEAHRLARAQAMELRHTIETVGDEDGSAPLWEKLATLAAEMARDGLRAQLVVAELDNDTLSEVRQLAIRDAAREALRNTMKHAGTDKVIVRVEERDGGIAVITRDHGSGFDRDDRPPGFGISESITARLAEVGGTALVESSPGGGTRVTLWVPF